MDDNERGYLRIGELSGRVGVSPELLRAWERRYGLLKPSRSQGGFRLYSDADERRVRAMQENLTQGMAAAEAARLATEPSELQETALEPAGVVTDELRKALEGFDGTAAERIFERALTSYSLDATLKDLLLPYLTELGDRWANGDVSVAQEHYATNLTRARLLNLARGWDEGYGPRALLACPEGELHDLGLVMFGLALNRRGWRITFLGANTPADTILMTARATAPDLVAVAATDAEYLSGTHDPLAEIARSTRLVIAGRGASTEFAEEVGADLLDTDPVAGAETVSRTMPWSR